MTRVFFDTNIIIDWLNGDSSEKDICEQCIEKSLQTGGQLLISPTTLAIVFYFVSKQYKNKSVVIQKLKESTSIFEFTTEDAKTVEQSFNSTFTDIEDALQYFSAANSNADVIITYNISDYHKTKIPAYHPNVFLSLFE